MVCMAASRRVWFHFGLALRRMLGCDKMNAYGAACYFIVLHPYMAMLAITWRTLLGRLCMGRTQPCSAALIQQ